MFVNKSSTINALFQCLFVGIQGCVAVYDSRVDSWSLVAMCRYLCVLVAEEWLRRRSPKPDS